MRRQQNASQRIFFVWGLDARGTLGAADWLVDSWSRLHERYQISTEDDFTAIIRISPISGYEDPIRCRTEWE
jgi:hypothetical protein